MATTVAKNRVWVKCVGMLIVLAVILLGTTATVFADGEDNVGDVASTDAKGYGTRPPRGLPLPPIELRGSESQSEAITQVSLQEEMPLYSQLDNVGTEWTSCGPTALAMVLNYLESGPTPSEIIEYAVSNVGTDDTLLYEPQDTDGIYTSPQHLYEIASYYGLAQAGWVTSEDEAQETLRELLSQGLPVIVDATVSLSQYGTNAAHFVVATELGTDNTVVLYDPYGEGWGGQVRTVSWEDFYWSWQNNSDGDVDGHGWWMVVVGNLSTTSQSA